MEQFKGTGVALITPFTKNNEIDLEALKRLVDYQVDNGVDYLVVLGTTGETATLNTEEKALVMSKVIEYNKDRLPLVIGIGGNNTLAVANDIKNADLDGFAAILSVSPYYNKPSQEGIYQHYKMISEVSPLPVILYNVPPRTGSNILPETAFRLFRDFDNIIGIKEAAGDFEQVLELIKHKEEDFLVLSGEDKLALPLVLAGGDGVISVIGQALPKSFSDMILLGRQGDNRKAFSIYYSLAESIDLIFAEGNPAGVKCMLNSLNITDSYLRLPLVPVSMELRQKINTFVSIFKN